MKTSMILLAAWAFLTASAANAGDTAVEAPIRAMMAGFNKGDIALVKAQHVAAPTIIDNVAPYRWSGADGFDAWLSDLGKAEAAEGKSDGVVWFGDPVDEAVSGGRAYVVTPCSYTYKQHGQTMRETGMTSFVLVNVADAWKVESWSWASPKAVAAK
jgi:hypothetical protein